MKKNDKQPKRTQPKFQPKTQAPSGYEKRTDDLVGFFDLDDDAIQFIPLHAKVGDNKVDKAKFSVLIVCRYISGAVKFDGAPVVPSRGDLVGLWYKPGMRAVGALAGVPVWLCEVGEVDTGKPNPMKLFDVRSKDKGGELLIVEDYRKESKTSVLPFDVADEAVSGVDTPF